MYQSEGDKYFQSFWTTLSTPHDNDRGLAVFFIWRKTTESAAESDDNIMYHPSSFRFRHSPFWKQELKSAEVAETI